GSQPNSRGVSRAGKTRWHTWAKSRPASAPDLMAMTSPGPEARLLLVLARARLDEDHRRAARALLQGPLDWEMWLGMVERHGLVPLAHRHLEALGATIPRNVRARLWARAEATAQRNDSLCRELSVVVGALREHGIDRK